MNLEIHPGHLAWSRAARACLARGEQRLAARVQRFDLEPAAFEADFGQAPDGTYLARVALASGDERIEVRAAEASLRGAVRHALADLGRQVDRRWRPRRASARRRPGARLDLARLLRGGPDLHQELLHEGLASLERAAAWELARLQLEGDLEPGLIDPEDVVGEVLAEELDHVDPFLGLEATVATLQDRVVARVDERAAELAQAPVVGTSIDQQAEREPPARAVSTLGSDLAELWGPEEVLFLEDVLGASPDDPEAVVLDAEARRDLVQALFVLPSGPRRLVEQLILDGFSLETVCDHEQLRPDEALVAVDEALQALARMLSDDERLDADHVRALYAALGQLLRDERAARTAELVRTEFPA